MNGRSVFALRAVYAIFMPKAAARFAIAWPMRPMPTMPSRAPDIMRPSGSGPFVHSPARTKRSARPICRAQASISAIARSATSSFSTSGVWVTTTPAAFAAATSMPS